MTFKVEKNIVVNTEHIKPSDQDLLFMMSTAEDERLTVHDSEHWTLIYLRGPVGNLDQFSPQFRELFFWAQGQGEEYTYLKLDPGGPKLKQFPVCPQWEQ